MRIDYIWYIAMFGLILISLGLLIDDESFKEYKLTKASCTFKGQTTEYKLYKKDTKEWINTGSYRKDTIIEIDKDYYTKRYDIVFDSTNTYNELTCEYLYDFKCDSEDINILTKSHTLEKEKLDKRINNKIKELEKSGYICIKE